jgi:trigger factor
VKDSKFDELPELLITEEKHKMFAELKGRLAEQQIPFEDYLKNLGKTEVELAKEFTHGATERVKTALILREIAKEENITVDPKETEAEIQRLRETYKDNPHLEERLASPDILDYINATILNRKIMKMLKEAIIK